AAALGCVFLATACVQAVPVDPEGTLDTVRAGTLRVGVSPASDFVEIRDGAPQGAEPALIEDFAQHAGAEIQWTIGGEEQLVEQLKAGQLDLVAGGITSKTPWSEKAGVTRPYTTTTDAQGKEKKIVLLVPPGENAFLSELEYFLDQTQEMP
ncbi:transporter substrate-binding domain-containing protein, partial [Glutamicibacter arilaitensis]|uniref:transporter substrate-binding domain-containing protein n=1 Tax=Glutamicibacter arilaitensis TaxID=256701 RepID=UPI003FD49E0E